MPTDRILMHLLQVLLLTLAAAWVGALPTRPPALTNPATLPPPPLPPHLQFGAPGMPTRPRRTPGKSNAAGPSGKGSTPAGNDPNIGRGVVNNPEEAIVNAAGSDNWKYDQSNGGFSPPSDWDRTPGGERVWGAFDQFKQRIGERNSASHNVRQERKARDSAGDRPWKPSRHLRNWHAHRPAHRIRR